MSPIIKRRFESEEQILAAIDKHRGRIERLRKTASSLEGKAKKLLRSGDGVKALHPDKRMQAELWFGSAERKRQKADKIEGAVLTRLKNRLATFRTELLPAVGFTDRSIPQ